MAPIAPTFWFSFVTSEQPGRLFFVYFYIVILALPQHYGLPAIYWIYPCAAMFPITIIKTILDYAGAHKNVVKLKIPYWQTFGASGIGCAALVGLGWLFYTFIYIPGFQIIGFYPIFGVTIVHLYCNADVGLLPNYGIYGRFG